MDEKTIKAAESVLAKGDRWFHCPYCGKKIFPIRPDTKIEHMPFRCKACKNDIEINI